MFSCTVVLPLSLSNAGLWEHGGSGTGSWVGLRDSGATFRVRAGDGGSAKASSDGNTAVLDVPSASLPFDGLPHRVTWDIQINPGRVRLWVDGVFYGSSQTSGGGALESNKWSGNGTGHFLIGPNGPPSGEPNAAWPDTSGSPVLTCYQNQQGILEGV